MQLVELANTFTGVRHANANWNSNRKRMPKPLDFVLLRNKSVRARSRSRKRNVAGKRLADSPKNKRLFLQPNVLSWRQLRSVSDSCSVNSRDLTSHRPMTKAPPTLRLSTAPRRRARFSLPRLPCPQYLFLNPPPPKACLAKWAPPKAAVVFLPPHPMLNPRTRTSRNWDSHPTPPKRPHRLPQLRLRIPSTA